MLRKIAIAVVVVLAALALFVASRPAEFRIERSATIDAPPQRVFPLVNDLHAWAHWSPWEKKDPDMERAYSGPRSGVGAAYAWQGNEDVGSGRMTITDSAPNERIEIRLEFEEPFPATHDVEFRFEPVAGGTRVVWGMDGENDFIGKLFALVMDLDAMVGADFESGLADLERIAENGRG